MLVHSSRYRVNSNQGFQDSVPHDKSQSSALDTSGDKGAITTLIRLQWFFAGCVQQKDPMYYTIADTDKNFAVIMKIAWISRQSLL